MRLPRATTLRTRLTVWYVAVLAVLLVVYAVIVFAFQYAVLTRQLVHDEVQDVVTVEGLLFFDNAHQLQLQQGYYSRPQSHLLIDRLMEVREQGTGAVLYRSPTLHGLALGGALRAGEGDRDFSERLVRLDDGTHVLLISHVHALDGRQLVIRLGYSLRPLRQRLVQFVLLLLLGIPLALALAALFGQLIAKRALQPLETMTLHAEGITAHSLHDRLEITNSADELGHMARVFNQLLQRLEESFVQLRRFTSDAAHELRTPLAAIRATGEIALQQPRTAEGYRATLSDILEETARLSGTIDSLLLLSRAEEMSAGEHTSTFSLSSLVAEVLTLLEPVMEERAIRVLQQPAPALNDAVHVDRSLIRIVLMNILHNAVKFSPGSSALHISYAPAPGPPPALQITVQDEGPGITPGQEALVFERFFTGARDPLTQAGTGLGLAIARLIVERSGGTIHFDTTVHTGAKCVVTLPASRS